MEEKLAILHSGSGEGEARVTWHQLKPPSHQLPDVTGFDYLDFLRSVQPGFEDTLPIAMRHARRLAGLARALRWPDNAVQPCAMIETFAAGHAQLQINPYVKTALNGRDYFLHARGTKSISTDVPIRKIRFVTGLCLFSNRVLTALTEEGRPVDLLRPGHKVLERIKSLEARTEFSFYELESCARQARLICDVAKCTPGLDRLDVIIDVPREQYYCYLLEAFDRGLVSRELMWKWLILVDARYDQVVACMQVQLLSWARRLGLSEPRIRLAAGFAGLRERLVEAITEEHMPPVEELLAELAASNEIWSDISSLEPPTTLTDLINTSYAVDYVRAETAPEAGNSLLIAVEDRSEVRIYEAAKRLAAELHQKPAIIGLYALEKVFLADAHNWSLYLNDPGARFTGDSRDYTSEELLAELYGAKF
jgi:hypothetical protein